MTAPSDRDVLALPPVEWLDTIQVLDTATADQPDGHVHLPAPIDIALRDRYAHPSTVNHASWQRRHVAGLATPGSAPGPSLPRRRRVNWWSLLSGITAVALILLSIVGTVAILRQIAEL